MDSFCCSVYLRFVFVCHTVVSGPCSLEVICLERAGPLFFLYVTVSCDFVTFPYGVLC